MLRTWTQRLGAPLLGWAALCLLGCGGTLQAEDSETIAIVTRARELYDAADYTAARDKAAPAVGRSPSNPQALYLRGLAYIALGDYAAGREDLEAAQKIDPLLMFAKSKDEFDTAWRTARDNTMQALGEGLVETPPVTEPPPELDEPLADDRADAPPPDPSQSDDPLVRALAGPEPVIQDLSGANFLGADQIKLIEQASSALSNRGVTLKVVVFAAQADVEAEARRLFDQSGSDDTTLLVVAASGPKIAAYTPTLAPDSLRAQVDKALSASDRSLARQIIAVAGAVGGRIVPPPLVPEPPSGPETATPPDETSGEGTAEPEPDLPQPTAGGPELGIPDTAAPASTTPPTRSLVAVSVGGGALLGILIWTALARVAARRRLTAGFAVADPRLVAVADRLTAVCRKLLANPVRPAARAFTAAELAYFEAADMMAEAATDDTADIGRVERSVRLLEEAEAKLADAETALAEVGEGQTAPASAFCYFTGRPIFDRHDGDIVLIRHGGEERLVLASPAVGDAIRRGRSPEVRVQRGPDGWLHWARVPGFDPAHELFHPNPQADRRIPIEEVAEPLFENQETEVFVSLDEPPDYTLDLDRE